MTAFTRLLAAAAALAPTLAAAPATAQSFSPAPSSGTISNAAVTLQQTITIQCGFSSDYSVNAAGDLSLSNETFSPGSFFCGTLVQAAQNWAVETVTGSINEVDVTIGFTFLTSVCRGTVRASYDNATGRIELNNEIIPSINDDVDCRIDGDLFTSPALTITP